MFIYCKVLCFLLLIILVQVNCLIYRTYNTTNFCKKKNFQNCALDLHNLFRDTVNVPPLTYNAKLEKSTKNLINTTCFNHSPNKNRSLLYFGENSNIMDGDKLKPNYYVGENLYMEIRSINDKNIQVEDKELLESGIKSWWKEFSDGIPSFETFSVNSFRGKLHATQMAWYDTQKVGCATRFCNNMTVLMCNYYPAGNVITYKIFESNLPKPPNWNNQDQFRQNLPKPPNRKNQDQFRQNLFTQKKPFNKNLFNAYHYQNYNPYNY